MFLLMTGIIESYGYNYNKPFLDYWIKNFVFFGWFPTFGLAITSLIGVVLIFIGLFLPRQKGEKL